MNIKAVELKKWCLDNISPFAWSRLVLNILPELRKLGYNLSDVEHPSTTLVLGEIELKVLGKALVDLYGMELPTEVVYG